MLRCILLLSLLATLLTPTPSRAQAVRTGAEVLSSNGFASLKGKKFALVTNQSAQVAGVHLLDLMERAGVRPALIFTPEHGFRGTAEDGVKLSDGSLAGIPLKSLYGATRKPNPEDLKGLDLVIFDIQDTGVRFYTYISTMGLAMQAAAEAGVPFMVLDRPNPLGGDYVAGFVRREMPATFTSLYPIPLAHGMTVGELAQMIQGEGWLPGLEHLELIVVRMRGWRRQMRWPDTGLPWVATSPNIASFNSALLYPGTGLLEGTSASEGRGTQEPFCLAGWPGVDAASLAQQLNARELPGVRFEPLQFTPVSLPGKSSAPKYQNRQLGGVRIEITDYQSVRPLETGTALVCALYQSVPASARKVFFRGGFEDMSGSPRLRPAIEKGETAAALDALWSEEVRKFRELREEYLLYPDQPEQAEQPGQPVEPEQPEQPSKAEKTTAKAEGPGEPAVLGARAGR